MKVEFEERLVDDAVITNGCCSNTKLVEFSLVYEVLYGFSFRLNTFSTTVKCRYPINSRDSDEWLTKLKKGFKVKVCGDIHFNNIFSEINQGISDAIKNNHFAAFHSDSFPPPIVRVEIRQLDILDTTPPAYQESKDIVNLHKPVKEDEKEKGNEA